MREWTEPASIDANVILRYVLRDHPVSSPKAKVVLDAVQEGRLTVFCDPVTLAEVVWVLKSVYKLSAEDIVNAVDPIIALEGLRMPDKVRYMTALRLYSTSVPDFGDACACAAAIEECGGRLISFDRDLSRVKGLSRREEP